MGINRGKLVHKAKIYAAIFIVLAVILVDAVTMYYIELSKRQQARFNLEHTAECMFMRELTTMESITPNGAKYCLTKMRTSDTGDMYLLDRKTKEFLFDNSTDAPKGMFFTKDSIGKYFTEWGTAEEALKHMLSGNKSNSTSLVSYNYDGSPEWLEYLTYSTLDGTEYVIVQGTQRDEVRAFYEVPRIVGGFLATIYILWLISTAVRGSRYDDTGFSVSCK